MTPEALLAEAAWLRRLALTLAGDADDAEDLVQETWITAWRRSPDTSRPLRPWLGKVLRDQSKMRRRGEARRTRREAAVSDPGAVAAPDELLDQVRLHRLLVDLVLELDEPYRTTVLARYVEGHSSAAIAKHLGVPESTVRGRLHEALAKLRARLDEINGERKAWAPAVLAFAAKGLKVARASKTGIFIVALVLLLLGAAGVWVATNHHNINQPLAAGAGAVPARTHGEGAHWNTTALATLTASQTPPGWFAQQGAKSRRIAGTVLVDGAPAAGVLVRLEDEASTSGLGRHRETHTGADGHFDFGVQRPTRYELGAYLPGRVATVKAVDLRDPHVNSESVIVVLESCVIGLYGRVLDASGGPIVHAQLLAQGVIGVESDTKGSFDICLDPAAAWPEKRTLIVRASGYGTVKLVGSITGRVRHDFMLSPEATISGRVVDQQGNPVAMASVRISSDEAAPRPGSEQPASARAVSDAAGSFEIAGVAAGRLRIQAFSRGAASALSTIDVGVGGTRQVTLTVGQRGILRGRVVSNGKPIGGVHVFNRADLPTYQARSQVTASINEAVSQDDGTFVLDDLPLGTLALGTSPYRLLSPATIQVTAGEQSTVLDVEKMASLTGTVRRNGQPVPHAFVRATGTTWTHSRTTEANESGRYAFEDLDSDDYQLFAHSAEIGAYATVDKRIKVEVGTSSEADIELQYAARISGSVVDANGAPVADALVTFQSTTSDDQSRCISDASGHFSCGSMTGGAAYRVEVAGSEASPKPYPFVGDAPAPIVLRDGNAHVDDLRLVVDASSLAIKGIVVDRRGDPVPDARVLANAGLDPWSSVPTAVTNLRGEFELPDLSPGSYGLQAIGTDGGRTLVNGIAAGSSDVRLTLDPPSCDDMTSSQLGNVLHEAPSSISNRPSARVVWDDSLELLGWDIPARIHVGDSVQITLYYKVLKPLDRSWKIFIHMDGPKMRINGDHDPLGGHCPTTTWKPGDVIVDRTTLRVDPSMDGGTYNVLTGFFGGIAPNWKNLPLSDAPPPRDEFQQYKLTSVEVDK